VERLTAPEGRVVASLVEKQLTIPQHYPLTLNALVAACNQSSSRDPVTTYAESEVLGAVESLKAKRMVRAVLPSHGRSVVRYRHVLDETFGLDAPQLAVLAVLELRGPQTVAELRSRTERMAAVESVDHELELLAAREEALAVLVGRRPGQKEDRWASLLAEPASRQSTGPGASGGAVGSLAVTAAAPTWRSDDASLRSDVDALREDIDAVREELETLRSALEAMRSGLEELRTNLGG
jgi:uncharacterized protein YceH (UPF0502 family)